MRFKSKEIQQQFEQDGAVVIPKFLNQLKIDRILSLYNELGITEFTGIYSNVKDKNDDFNSKVDLEFQNIYKESIAKHFEDYQIGGGAFLIKGTGPESHSSLHQDWNVVDETKYQSAAIFCPTVDVNEKNGCIQVIKGSHKWFNNIRSFEYPSVFLTFDQINKGLKSYPIKAGDAVIFRHNVFHGSKPNYTNKTRVAASLSISSKEANYLHYIKEGDSFNIIDASKNFFNNDVSELYLGNKIEMDIIDRIPFDQNLILDFETVYSRYKKEYPDSFLEQIASYFKSS